MLNLLNPQSFNGVPVPDIDAISVGQALVSLNQCIQAERAFCSTLLAAW